MIHIPRRAAAAPARSYSSPCVSPPNEENHDESRLPRRSRLAGRVFGVAATVLFIAEEVVMRSKSSSSHQYHTYKRTGLVSCQFPPIHRLSAE